MKLDSACLWLTSIAITASLFSSVARTAEDGLKQRIVACAKLGATLERLNCYDQVSATLGANEAVAASDPAPLSNAATLFGTASSDAAPAGVKRTELKAISARIVSFEAHPNGAVITLDNGQRWQQEGHEDLMLKDGEKVVLSRGAFGSFWIMTEYNRSAHAKRLL